jgi:hypothetical protein
MTALEHTKAPCRHVLPPRRLLFRRPFPLKGFGGLQPAGTYVVETEEELLEGLSFPAYRRVSTTITLRPSRAGALVQVLPVDPRELAAAQAQDTRADGR